MSYVELVTVAALLQFVGFSIAVGRARATYKINAPATSGHEVFDRYFRVHQNTLEQLVVFLPALWLFALRVSPHWAAGFGLVYLVGRLVYFYSYIRNPASRGLGFGMSAMPSLAMLLTVAVVILRQALGG